MFEPLAGEIAHRRLADDACEAFRKGGAGHGNLTSKMFRGPTSGDLTVKEPERASDDWVMHSRGPHIGGGRQGGEVAAHCLHEEKFRDLCEYRRRADLTLGQLLVICLSTPFGIVHRRRDFRLSRGEATLMHACETGRVGSRNDVRYYSIKLQDPQLRARCADPECAVAHRVPRQCEALQLLRGPRYLQRLFEMTGTPFTARVNELRLERALALLVAPAEGRLRISDVALQVGFSDISHFNRSFRARFGDTPGAMRASEPATQP